MNVFKHSKAERLFFILFIYFGFFETGSRYIAVACLELTEVPLPLLPEYWV